MQSLRGLQAAVLAGEEGDGGLGGDRLKRSLDGLQLLVFPALDPIDHDEPPAERERHRSQRVGHRLGRRGVAFEQLDPLGAALRLCDGT